MHHNVSCMFSGPFPVQCMGAIEHTRCCKLFSFRSLFFPQDRERKRASVSGIVHNVTVLFRDAPRQWDIVRRLCDVGGGKPSYPPLFCHELPGKLDFVGNFPVLRTSIFNVPTFRKYGLSTPPGKNTSPGVPSKKSGSCTGAKKGAPMFIFPRTPRKKDLRPIPEIAYNKGV